MNHLQEAKDNLSKVTPVNVGLDVWVEYATAHALIAIAEQLEKMHKYDVLAEILADQGYISTEKEDKC